MLNTCKHNCVGLHDENMGDVDTGSAVIDEGILQSVKQ